MQLFWSIAYRALVGFCAQICCETWIWCFLFVVVQDTVAQYDTENKIEKRRKTIERFTTMEISRFLGLLCSSYAWNRFEKQETKWNDNTMNPIKKVHANTCLAVQALAKKRLCDGWLPPKDKQWVYNAKKSFKWMTIIGQNQIRPYYASFCWAFKSLWQMHI